MTSFLAGALGIVKRRSDKAESPSLNRPPLRCQISLPTVLSKGIRRGSLTVLGLLLLLVLGLVLILILILVLILVLILILVLVFVLILVLVLVFVLILVVHFFTSKYCYGIMLANFLKTIPILTFFT